MGKLIKRNKADIILCALAVLMGVLCGVLICGQYTAEAVIGGTGNVTDTTNPHNLSAGSSGIKASTETRVCVFCHTPHNAISDASLINAPLWNHKLSSATYTLKTPGLYDSGTGVVGIVNMSVTPTQPDGESKLCLSCHDGTVAVGDVQSEIGGISMVASTCLDASGRMIESVACPQTIGVDLTAKHVVSIPMNQTLIDNSAANCASQTTKLKYPWSGPDALPDTVLLRPTAKTYGTTYGVTYPTAGMPANGKYKTGYNYGVQCSSCHDPHMWSNVVDTEGYKFLVTDFNSLCKACHTPILTCP